MVCRVLQDAEAHLPHQCKESAHLTKQSNPSGNQLRT